jgi:hypothetical protein
MATTDERIAEGLDAAVTQAYSAIQSVHQSLANAGPEAHQAFKALADRTAVVQGIGTSARDFIDQLRADESKPVAYRQQMSAQIYRAAEQRLREERNAMVKDVLPKLEATLRESTLPPPSKDAADRQLRRGELDRLLAGHSGAALTQRMTEIIGKNMEHDRELLSDFGKALLDQAGVGNDWPTFRAGAAAKLLSSPVGSEKQLANRKALAAFHQTKLVGHVDGLFAIARSKLGDAP